MFLLTPGYLLANADGCSYFKDKLADRMKYYRNSKKTDEIKNSYGYAYTDIQSCLMHEKKSEYCIKIKEEALGKAIDCANKRINVSIPNNIDWLVAPFLLIKYQEDKKCPVKKSLYNYRLWRDPYINTYLEKEKIKIKIKGVTGYKIRKALIEKSGCKIKKRRLIKKSSDNYKNIYILKVKNKETYTTVNKVDYISTKNIDYFENCPRLRPSGYIESVKQLKDCHFKLGIVKNNPILSVVSHIVEIKQGKIFSIKNNSKNLAIIKDVKIIIRKKNENGISNYTIKIVDRSNIFCFAC